MSRAATLTVGDQITTLLTGFTLTTAAREMVSRFVQAEQQPALPLLLEVLELEAQERHERRITRLRRASKLPPGKTFATLDEGRLPPALVRRSTSSPTATSWTTRPMSSRSACQASARATRCAPSATRSSIAATPCSSCRPTASCRSSSPRSGIWTCRAPYANSITSRCWFSTMWATSSRVPKRLRFSSRSSPNATSDARSSSPAI